MWVFLPQGGRDHVFDGTVIFRDEVGTYGDQLFSFLGCLYGYGLFILDPVPLVSGSALLMISPALKANETRKSCISLRFGFSMIQLRY